jgi:hypothetical protein
VQNPKPVVVLLNHLLVLLIILIVNLPYLHLPMRLRTQTLDVVKVCAFFVKLFGKSDQILAHLHFVLKFGGAEAGERFVQIIDLFKLFSGFFCSKFRM